MSDYSHSVGEFSDRSYWSRERRTSLMVDLINIVQAHAYRKFGCAVVNETFGQLADELRARFRLTAYVLAARTCAASVRTWALEDGWARVPIAYVFEDGDPGKTELIERMQKDAFPAPVFWAKKDKELASVAQPGFTPLQAADILAYELFLVAKRGEATRRSFVELDRTPPGVTTMYTARDFGELEQRLSEIGDDPSVEAM